VSARNRSAAEEGPTASQRLEPRSLEQAVYETVLARILVGDVKPGDPLVEAQLSEEFGISKTPVREALIRLKRDGLVDQSPFKMGRVATPTPDDVRQVCEVRRWIEPHLAANAAHSGDPSLVSALEATIADAEMALGDGDIPAWAAAIGAFSDVLVSAWGNWYGADLLQQVRNVLVLTANVSQDAPGRRQRSIDEHRAICDAIAAGDPARAAQATSAHVDSIERDSLQTLRAPAG
jgi:GntR family transcriptional regulator, rspAB operon transcriptional repressor